MGLTDVHAHCHCRNLFSLGSWAKNEASVPFHSTVCILKACQYRAVLSLADPEQVPSEPLCQ